ncbi:Glycoside hydrolase, family 25 [Anopheles sinensis]|uniref:Glycoside hydrolase, family 25 n=1 Tax=Anopheles sinensis TaxID=74873 RepID=A0A084VU24_ANOSI|nr:Glycoside hydrolase, family 25 [Anopheles sinensis]
MIERGQKDPRPFSVVHTHTWLCPLLHLRPQSQYQRATQLDVSCRPFWSAAYIAAFRSIMRGKKVERCVRSDSINGGPRCSIIRYRMRGSVRTQPLPEHVVALASILHVVCNCMLLQHNSRRSLRSTKTGATVFNYFNME